MATIKVMQNGPYLVQGDDVTAVDWNGATYAIPKRPFALCRYGGSTNKPFCDGTYSRTGFKAPSQQSRAARTTNQPPSDRYCSGAPGFAGSQFDVSHCAGCETGHDAACHCRARLMRT